MSSSNKTANYQLSQFLGADKPSWLTDVNADMTKIDTQMKANNTLAQQGVTDSASADAKASQAQADATQALTNAETAQNTANSANTKGQSALDKIESFDLNNFESIPATSIFYYVNDVQQSSNGIRLADIHVATNTDGSIFKVYGSITLDPPTATSVGEWRFSTDIRPTQEININSAGIRVNTAQSYTVTTVSFINLKIKVDGTVIISGVRQATEGSFMQLSPCLYFAKSFGD